MRVAICVLNYNGKDLLAKFLPSVCAAAKNSVHDCNVVVVDNCSTDESAAYVRENFKQVTLHEAKENKVLCSYNEVLAALDAEVAILLNNDIEVKIDFVDPLMACFSDEHVFFAAPCILNFDHTFNGGKSYLYLKLGIIKNIVDKDSAFKGGATHSIATGAFRRKFFLRMGGFDELYLPGIWEEIDLCYRGQLLGWRGAYEPKSVIWHQESTTFNKEFGSRKKLIIAHRNMFLFFWKNIHDADFIAQHIFFIPLRIIYSVLSGKTEFALGFIYALPRLFKALAKRENLRTYSDCQILR